MIKKHLPTSLATELGHLRQEKQHLQSTKNNLPIDGDHFPQQQPKTRDMIFTITSYNEKEVAAADLTGKFPYKSS